MVKVSSFGHTAQGREIKAYTLFNSAGAELTVIDYGATIQALKLPDRSNMISRLRQCL